MTTAIIPLGTYFKRRLPDLEVRGPDGLVLPTLARSNRSHLVSTLFTIRYLRPVLEGCQVGDQTNDVVSALLTRIVAAVAVESEEVALGLVTDLRRSLRKMASALPMAGLAVDREEIRRVAQAILDDVKLLPRLSELATKTEIFAMAPVTPGRSLEIRFTFSERFEYARSSGSTESLWARTRLRFDRTLAFFGLSTTTIVRKVPNATRCESYYLMVNVPEGTEPIRFFWEHEQNRIGQSISDGIDTDRATLAVYSGESDSPIDRDFVAMLDVQVQPSAGIMSATILVAMIGLVSLYTYQRFGGPNGLTDADRDSIGSTASLLSAGPAVLVGAFAYKGASFARRLARGLRILLFLVAGLSVILSATLPLRDYDGLVELLGLTTTSIAAVTLLILLHIELGPRWRHSGQTRLPRLTLARTNRKCQSLQRRCAAGFTAFLAVFVAFYVRVVYHLQEQRVLTKDFPGNLWDAIRSWFA